MQKVLTAAEMREVDRLTVEKYGIPSLLLMENAAHAAARAITEKLGGSVAGKRFIILCGKGNNGGDGAALARILALQDAVCFVYLLGTVEETKGDAQINFKILKNIENDKRRLGYVPPGFESRFVLIENPFDALEIGWGNLRRDNFDVIVDAVFGTGFAGKIEGSVEQIIEELAGWNGFEIERAKNLCLRKEYFFVSLDIPSGLNADVPQITGANFHADLTITFTAPKPANVLPSASRFNGELVTVNIGSPQELIDNSPSQLFLAEKLDAQNWLRQTRFTVDSYKKIRGHALIVAGSKEMSGAAVLCADAAMQSGVGLVTIATPEAARLSVSSRVLPEIMVSAVAETTSGAIDKSALKQVLKLSERMNVVAIGCGLSSNEESTRNFVKKFIEQRRTPVVIDADGLNALSPFELQGSAELPLVLTPHIGEMRRLLGVDEAADLSDRVKISGEFARKHNVILVLKGERSLIASPDGTVVINPTGNPGIGKAGNGDTLTGIITGFIAQTLAAGNSNMFETVVAALYIAGTAGDIAEKNLGIRSMTASDVRECLGDAFRQLEQ